MGEKSFSSSSDDQQKVAYFGVPLDSVYRFTPETGPPYGVPLNPRTDIAELGTIGSDRRDSDADRAHLCIAILADYLGERARVARLYNAFSQRTRYVFPAERRWMVTEIEVAALVKVAERDSHLTWNDKRGRYQDEPDEDLAAHKTFRKPKKEEAALSAATR
jgi:hypothetical protein